MGEFYFVSSNSNIQVALLLLLLLLLVRKGLIDGLFNNLNVHHSREAIQTLCVRTHIRVIQSAAVERSCKVTIIYCN
jgi:hypothetical protein